MSYVLISGLENVDAGNLQAEGEAVAVFASEAPARAHFTRRGLAIAAAVRDARERDVAATFISWIVLLRMPLDVGTVDEALEDLELVLAETESTDDPFGELVVSYEGRRHAPDRTTDHAQAQALRVLEAWLG